MAGAARVWLDGRVVDRGAAHISVFDHGLTVGDGVFETLRAYGGRPFAVRRHLERLEVSAAGLGLRLPATDVLRRALEEVLAANGLADGAVRITVTGGAGPFGTGRGDAAPTVIVVAAEVVPWPPTADVAVVPWPRNERGALSGLKTISYGENVVALRWAVSRSADEALFTNLSGNLCEGTSTNVFLGLGGRLHTPPLASGCLAGVTRQLVVEACDVVERDLSVAELTGADEAFLTSTTREVQPIRAVDATLLPAAPGPLTKAAGGALAAVVARDMDP
ncbi:MAG: aminotransferase class IV [Actinomycetota bacterium]|nr:aminotransferase class IV [Actinomycetota bacterium]MDQ3678999.1 aminotransferase class IV [Actinomycetota bacterium]